MSWRVKEIRRQGGACSRVRGAGYPATVRGTPVAGLLVIDLAKAFARLAPAAEAASQAMVKLAGLASANIFTHYWRVKTRLPERFGYRCRVTAYGAMNSCRVEFGDGFKVITSRYYVRRLR